MAGENRTPSHLVELLELLDREPFAFDFYQAIRLLDCARPDAPQTGHSETLKDDPFRLGQEPSLAFAPSTVSDMEPAGECHPPRLIQRFLGLLGPQGPLPLHLTDYARSRIRHQDDHTFTRFLDVFHHRMIALFYRSWARVRPTVNFDRGAHDRFGEYVAAVFGLGMPSLENRDALPDLPKRHFAGLLGGQTKHADGLLAMIRGYFGLPAQIEQFVGQWIELPVECQCRMGSSPSVSRLGQSITMGSHVWDCQQKFRVVMGPLDLDEYYHLLPATVELIEPQDDADPLPADALAQDGSQEGQNVPVRRKKVAKQKASGSGQATLDRLTAMIRGYIGDDLEWDLQLILKKEETPPTALGVQGQLGWSTWILRDEIQSDPRDLILDVMMACGRDETTKLEYQKILHWDHQTLGQLADGSLVLADQPGG